MRIKSMIGNLTHVLWSRRMDGLLCHVDARPCSAACVGLTGLGAMAAEMARCEHDASLWLQLLIGSPGSVEARRIWKLMTPVDVTLLSGIVKSALVIHLSRDIDCLYKSPVCHFRSLSDHHTI
jgi:hypothetical protein